jgi:hypothetical protein
MCLKVAWPQQRGRQVAELTLPLVVRVESGASPPFPVPSASLALLSINRQIEDSICCDRVNPELPRTKAKEAISMFHLV